MGLQKGVVLDFLRPGKPTDNGFIESFNGKFRAECLNTDWFLSLDDARTWQRRSSPEDRHPWGPCLAVNLNDRQDYFGQTVNIASRVQGLADPNVILATEANCRGCPSLSGPKTKSGAEPVCCPRGVL